MEIKNFYRCSKYHLLAQDTGPGRFSVMEDVFWKYLGSQGKNVGTMLQEAYANILFPFAWQREKYAKVDALSMQRFISWLRGEGEIHCCESFAYRYGDESYSGRCIIIRSKEGQMAAVVPVFGRSDKGFGGKDVHTNIMTSLYPLLCKACMEKKYPGIVVRVFFLLNERDADDVVTPDVVVKKARGGNLYTPDYSGFYIGNVFDSASFDGLIGQVLEKPVKPECYFCDRAALCKREVALETDESGEKAEAGYILPSFTPEQEEVVCHVDGAMRVCAGPGSGKTATLVGRVKRLLDNGVPPEFILLVTFTKDAAKEIEDRCRPFCTNGFPTISTIHSICYRILKENADVLGKQYKVLAEADRLELVENLLSVWPPIPGLPYGKEYGVRGLYRTAANRLEEYLAEDYKEVFFRNHPEIGESFGKLALQYRSILEDRGYISFDEIVPLVNQLFKEHPGTAVPYRGIYQYVMVDEFQDIDREQAMFIYTVASHGNLVVVGDDDQSIYGFRGGTGKYMLDFDKAFPKARTVVLTKNFRSTEKIVNASDTLIRNNRARISKMPVAERKGGVLPVTVAGKDAFTVEQVVNACLQKGYSYGDIAIFSTRNKPLEDMHAALPVPNVLGRAYLRNTKLFVAALNALRLWKTPQNIFAEGELSKMADVGAMRDSFLPLCSNIDDPSVLIHELSLLAGAEAGLAEMLELVEELHIKGKEDLLSHLEYMERFEDERRIKVVQGDRVLLVTSHESKGREFPVVLLLDDFKESGEEARRLWYVAMTRAKDMFFILRDGSSNVDFSGEFETQAFAG